MEGWSGVKDWRGVGCSLYSGKRVYGGPGPSRKREGIKQRHWRIVRCRSAARFARETLRRERSSQARKWGGVRSSAKVFVSSGRQHGGGMVT